MLLVNILICPLTYSYPTTIVKGYRTCISCHTTASGGTVLNDYGRSMASDFMSTFSKEDEAEDYLKNIDYRLNYRHLVIDNQSNTLSFPMFLDGEVSLRTDRVTLNVSRGIYSRERIPETRQSFIQYQPFNNFTVRAGYFMPTFGIMTNDHSLYIKKSNGLGRGSESYNLEIWLYKKNWFQSFFTVSAPSFRFTSTEENFYRLGTPIGNRFRAKIGLLPIKKTEIGFSFLWNVKELETYGFYAKSAPFNNKFYTIGELDIGRSALQRMGYVRSGYFMWKGMDFFAELDSLQNDLENVNKLYIGLDWSIRPRFEIGIKISLLKQYPSQYQLHGWL